MSYEDPMAFNGDAVTVDETPDTTPAVDRAAMTVVRAAWVLILLAVGALWLLGGVLFRSANQS